MTHPFAGSASANEPVAGRMGKVILAAHKPVSDLAVCALRQCSKSALEAFIGQVPARYIRRSSGLKMKV